MKIQSLTGAWEFRQVGTEDWRPAIVPGGVHTDLLALGLIPDPFVGDNEKRVQWVAENDWEYRLDFACQPELLTEEHILLTCDELDTLATVSLNGKVLGQCDNMYRQYQWEVKSLLEVGGNELHIGFDSPVRFAAQQQAIRPMTGVSQAIPGGQYLRKAPCHFGWDWGPQLPPIGIWKDIRLEGYNHARLSEVHVQQRHEQGRVTVEVSVYVERWGETELAAWVRINAPGGEVFEGRTGLTDSDEGVVEVPIPGAELWWPNGYGAQPLYQVEVSLLGSETPADKLLDYKKYQLGLRTIELRQEEDEWGRSFVFAVNGIPIFAKGANWIPADSFPTRITDEKLEYLIRSAAQAHQNMLRVWGGGIYEDERFYDLCDRYGMLVWQEFSFACGIYPLDDAEFLENVRVEVVENIRRLRHRASLAVWCGNNEMEVGWVEWNWDRPGQQDLKSAYEEFFHETLPVWCRGEDAGHAYWPSSPSSGTPFVDPNGQRRGDAHYWEVWHERKPFTAYREQFPRFMSEFGFQALPPVATVRTFADEGDWNMTSYIMEQHQKNSSGNSLIVSQMLDTFRLPKDFEALVYLSMGLQAEGIRYGVEHWRRHPERVAGTLYWQLNDCWPVISWSSMDYFGRWKALHYAARRFYAPILLSIEDKPPEQAIYITNDTLEPFEGRVSWWLEMMDGEVLTQGEVTVEVLPQTAIQVCSLDFTEHITYDNSRSLVFIAELTQGEQVIARQSSNFAPIKHLMLSDPAVKAELAIENGQLVIDLTSRSLALSVELSLLDKDVIFSDNYFNLPAGRTARVTCPLPEGWSLEQAQEALRIFSVYDSYAHTAGG